MRTLTIILLLTSITAPCLATKCLDDCTQFKIADPPLPESGYNVGKAASAILKGMFDIIRAKTPFGESWNALGYVGGGLFGGIWGASMDAREAAKMEEFRLTKNLQKAQDYLSCVMEAQVSGAIYQINQRMDDDRVNAFNNAIQGIVSYMNDNCAAHNCLNVTNVEPSQRNAAVGAGCMTPYPVAKGSDCTNITWRPRDPVLCTGRDVTGTIYEGICGVDGQCYHTEVGFSGAIKAHQMLKDKFLAKDAINNFDAFNDLRNPTAVVAYAKGAVVYLSVLQELHLLGSATAEDGTARQFARRAATWLQSRVDYHTSVNVTLLTVQDANEANTYNQEPLQIRKSCKSGDLAQQEKWLGCSRFSADLKVDTNVCLIKPNSMGIQHNQSLCMGVCNNNIQQLTAGYSAAKPQAMMIRNLGSLHVSAAKEMAAANQKLFESAGIYDIIESLNGMASTAMPDNSMAFYQTQGTPRWSCNATKPQLLKGDADAVPPLTSWEEPDNLSKGSVVLRGVVIGGDKIKGKEAAAAAPPKAKAKQPTAPVEQAAAPAEQPTAPINEPAGRRLLAH